MKILAIDTSCDETAAAVTDGTGIVSNIVWSQASAHAKFGGVMPSLAQRMHEERIDFVIDKALGPKHKALKGIDAIAVTVGPGLSIALGVGIDRAKKLSIKYKKPVIPVNHLEAHLLSPLSRPNNKSTKQSIKFPAYGLVVSGGNTLFVFVTKIGEYKILAETQDDALGEALDKGARLLGLGYPGGAVLEKMARLGDNKNYKLPIPLSGQEKRQIFSYSGLKTSFYRLIQSYKSKDPDFPSRQGVFDLSAAYQDAAFKHIERMLTYRFIHSASHPADFLLGGGVAANTELRDRLRKLGKQYKFNLLTPYSKKLYGDNAAMVGVAAFLIIKKSGALNFPPLESIDRNPSLKLGR